MTCAHQAGKGRSGPLVKVMGSLVILCATPHGQPNPFGKQLRGLIFKNLFYFILGTAFWWWQTVQPKQPESGSTKTLNPFNHCKSNVSLRSARATVCRSQYSGHLGYRNTLCITGGEMFLLWLRLSLGRFFL